MKMIISLFALLTFSVIACNNSRGTATTPEKTPERKATVTTVSNTDPIKKIVKSEEEWRAELTEKEYYVLREAGTERAFTGDLLNNKREGVYTCAGCSLPLFDSSTKFKSGTGWPSYYQPIDEKHVGEIVDNKYGWNRVEVVCASCDGHLGHVFDDGPQPTGLRYCINSVSLNFVEKETE